MKIHEQYLKAIEGYDEWLTVSEWAVRVGDLYPEILIKAEEEALNQKNDTTGLREIAARISSRLATKGFDNIEIDTSERPKKVRYITNETKTENIEQDLEDDIAPLKRSDIIKQHIDSLTIHELYRIDELETISKKLKEYFTLDFEVDHAQALLNPDSPGQHHPDNLQLLLRSHNGKKHSKNWVRFSVDEQIDYINSAIKLQSLVAPRMELQLEYSVLSSLLQRLKGIY
ncbi:HNH endonuclease signature motif containing protein [Psychromonas algicola]|uniref:HNH endonuclease signature motif containing protein n=1 Tax=Psychromonas algicola TaxID=2555642 RepID=UPI0010678F2B|nr:HNH endonuclease signature motif containing protein [Psychromonas sp. RZ5]TEW49572.1 HNH endonuclease [Psychromonas sp. RZ5]